MRILIADEHALFREGLEKLFESCPNMEVVGQASDGPETVQLVNDLMPDILLLDLFMRKMDGLRVLRRIRRVPGVHTIVVTAAISQREALDALRMGASAVLLKGSSSQKLLECIRSVYAGGDSIDPEAVADFIESRVMTVESIDPCADVKSGFTRREMDVMAAIVTGCSNKGIAVKLAISRETVKHHLRNIFYKTGVTSRLELAIYVRENKLVRENPLPCTASRVFAAARSATVQ
ncbi:MAG TPA: response regulator transcription factor [Terriglobia bacterium]|nr:response regulator transcription factor [Terriglobia bacterium]